LGFSLCSCLGVLPAQRKRSSKPKKSFLCVGFYCASGILFVFQASQGMGFLYLEEISKIDGTPIFFFFAAQQGPFAPGPSGMCQNVSVRGGGYFGSKLRLGRSFDTYKKIVKYGRK
jgi:hypothetical protein